MARQELRTHTNPRYQSKRKPSEAVEKLLQKIVTTGNTGDVPKKFAVDAPNKNTLETISSTLASNMNDAQAIFEILPDTELAMQVLVSSIISPKDMVSTDLSFVSTQTGEATEAAAAVIKIVNDHFTNHFPIKKRITTMLNEALFKKGAYPLLVLPENSLDHVINSTLQVSREDIVPFFTSDQTALPCVGLLGDNKKTETTTNGVSLEAHFSLTNKPVESYSNINNYTSVTDNFNALKMAGLNEKIRSDVVSSRLKDAGIAQGLHVGTEQQVDDKVLKSAYRRRHYTNNPIIGIQTPEQLGTTATGHPLVMKLPVESVIPVHVPSDPAHHVGYYVLLDKNGNPLTNTKGSAYYEGLRAKIKNNKNGVSELLEQTRESMFGNKDISIGSSKEMMSNYTQLVEADLLARLKNGVYGEDAVLSCPEEIGRIMFARALEKMHTQILFIPGELLTYITFNYNDNGTGKSLLEGSKIIASLRAMMLFANTMAAIKNSVSRTKVNVELDPQDPDPSQTVETIMHEFTRNHQAAYPLGTIDPSDITHFLQRASVDVNVTGNPAYPETTTSIEESNRSVNTVDSDLEESLRNRHFMSMGIAPEMIDATLDVEFATNLVGSNLLLAKRVIIYQEIFCSFLSDFIKTYTLNSSSLLEDIIKQLSGLEITKKLLKDSDVDENGDAVDIEQLARLLIQSINITLPTPDTAKLANQAESFDQFNGLLENALEAYFNADMVDGLLDSELESGIDPTIVALKGYFQRQWLRKNNIMPELEGMLTTDNEAYGFSLDKVHQDHVGGILKSMETLLRKMRSKGRKAAANLERDEDKDEEDSQAAQDKVSTLEQEVEELKAQLASKDTPEEEEIEEPIEEEEGEEGDDTLPPIEE